METYGVDVLDPRTSTRRVAVLLERIPPYARRPGEQWSTEAELLALLADQLAQLTWVTLRAAGAKSATRPRPIPRPRDRTNRRGATSEPRGSVAPAEAGRADTWADAARMLAGMTGMRRRDG